MYRVELKVAIDGVLSMVNAFMFLMYRVELKVIKDSVKCIRNCVFLMYRVELKVEIFYSL